MGTQNFFFVPRSWQDENIFLYFFTELKTYHLSNFYLLLLNLAPSEEQLYLTCVNDA